MLPSAVEQDDLDPQLKVVILAGTDLGNAYLYLGFSLYDELGLLVKAGLSPLKALGSATLHAGARPEVGRLSSAAWPQERRRTWRRSKATRCGTSPTPGGSPQSSWAAASLLFTRVNLDALGLSAKPPEIDSCSPESALGETGGGAGRRRVRRNCEVVEEVGQRQPKTAGRHARHGFNILFDGGSYKLNVCRNQFYEPSSSKVSAVEKSWRGDRFVEAQASIGTVPFGEAASTAQIFVQSSREHAPVLGDVRLRSAVADVCEAAFPLGS